MMGWADCGADSNGRPIGYAFAGTCDHPSCTKGVFRGLGSACGGMHGEGTLGGDRRIDWDAMGVSCEGYFCDRHLIFACLEHQDGADLYAPPLCPSCVAKLETAYREDEDWREHWPTAAPPIAQGTEARRDETRSGSACDGPVPTGCAQPPSSPPEEPFK